MRTWLDLTPALSAWVDGFDPGSDGTWTARVPPTVGVSAERLAQAIATTLAFPEAAPEVAFQVSDDLEPVVLAPGLVTRVEILAALSSVASDPDLDDAREALTRCAEGDDVLAVLGDRRRGRQLVQLAHAVYGLRRLITAPQDGRLPETGQWWLVDVEEDLDGIREPLERLLRRNPTELAEVASLYAARQRPDHPAFAAIVGGSPALVDALLRVEQLAPFPLPVLLVGETGTGKELFARALHDVSGRPGPFVPVDLATRAPELVPSDLFGHVKGAFSGADRTRAGAFQRAEGGTLFLDELENLPDAAQRALLRVLEASEVVPVGADDAITVDVRVVAATNEDPDALVASGRLREDLRYRLDAARIELPPLRLRPDDIPDLAAALLATVCDQAGVPTPALTAEALGALCAWHWPGNVRELRHALARAVATCRRGRVTAADLGSGIQGAGTGPVVLLADTAAALDALPTDGVPRVVLGPQATPEGRPARPSRRRVWRLDRAERDALNEAVLSYLGRGGSMNRVLRDAARTMDGSLKRLAHYVDGPAPRQYAIRLYAHPDNERLRTELLARLAETPELAERLPTSLGQVLDP